MHPREVDTSECNDYFCMKLYIFMAHNGYIQVRCIARCYQGAHQCILVAECFKES